MSNVKFKITIQEKGKKTQYSVEKDEFVIGRAKEADLVITNDLISRAHMKVTLDDGKIWIEELGSSNGSWYADKKLVAHKKTPYRPDEQLILGGKLGLPIQLAVEVEVNQKTHEEFWEKTKIEKTELTLPNFPLPSAAKVVKAEERIEDKILEIKTQGEKALFMQIKNLLGTEAEAIRSACLDEAQRIKKSAEQYSSQQYREAKEKSDRLLKDTEELISKKITELKRVESDAIKRLEALRTSEEQASQHVTELRAAEGHYQNSIKAFEEKIQSEENRIKDEIAKLVEDKHAYQALKTELERKIEDFNLDERKFKARVETELLEHRMKVTQISGEYERITTQKNSLEPEVARLKQERGLLEDSLHSLKISKREEEHSLENLKKEWAQTKFNLDEAQKTIEKAYKDTELKRDELAKWQVELKHCEEEKIQIMEDARKQAAAILEEAKVEAQKNRVNAEEQLSSLRKERLGLESEIEKERIKLTAQLELSMKKLTDKKADLIKDIAAMAKSGHDEYHATIQKGKDEYNSTLQLAQEDANQIIQNSKDRAEILLRDAQSVIDEKHKEQLAQIADLEAKKVSLFKEEEDVKAFLASQKQLMEQEIAASRSEQAKLISDAQTEAQRLLAKNEEEVAVLRKTMISGAEAQVQAILSEIEQKGKDARKKEEQLLAELKHAEMMKLKQLRSDHEAQWLETRTDRAKTVATNVYAVLASEMFKRQNQTLTIEFIESLSAGLKEKVVDTMLDRIGPDNDKLQEILKTGENAKNKEKRFWKKVQIGAAAAVVIIAMLSIFPSIITKPKDIIVSAFSEKSDNGSNEFLEQMKEKRKLMVFNPPTTPEFKETYVDNVLYTTNYYENFQAKEFQDKWILELNDWFVKGLDVKDTTIIKFVSLESNLVRELQDIKNKADGTNPQSSIDLMVLREKSYRQKLEEIFDSEDKVFRFYDYRQKFWNDHYNPRRPASKQ